MKKYLILTALLSIILLCGCGKYDESDAMKDFSKLVSETDNYNLKGSLEILSNEEIFKYKVDVAYRQGDYYKVNLINTSNDHEQIILKNDEGVYVITPSLNKSFKFQSEWPNNSSQAYILATLLQDLENDKERKFKEEKGKFIFTAKVNYPNNRNLVKEIITLDKKMNLKQVIVKNSEGINNIKFVVSEFNKKTNYKKSYFNLNNNVKEEVGDETQEKNKEPKKEQTTGSLVDNVIYPMYLPNNTKFESEEKVSVDGSQRVILNFEGEKPFTLIEETSTINEEFEVVPVYGELTFLDSSYGVVTNTSVNWSYGGKDYYLVGENLSEKELVQIALSTKAISSNK